MRVEAALFALEGRRQDVLDAIRDLRSELDSVEREVRTHGTVSGHSAAMARYARACGALVGAHEALRLMGVEVRGE
jgi:hypothetical protein